MCRQYARQLKSMQAAERQYTREMSRLFMDMRIEDGRRIDGVKAVLLDNLLAQKRVLEQIVKFTDGAIASVKAIDREKDVNEFVASTDLLYHSTEPSTDGKTGPETVFDLPPPQRGTPLLHSPARTRHIHPLLFLLCVLLIFRSWFDHAFVS